jgi:hypothetical protein
MRQWRSIALSVCVVTQLAVQGCGSDDDNSGQDLDAGSGAQPDAAPVTTAEPVPVTASTPDATVVVGAVDAGSPGVNPVRSDAGGIFGGLPRADAGGGIAIPGTPAAPVPSGVTLTPLKPLAAAGPDDGDPGKPVVAITEIPCRNPSSASFGLGRANFKIDNRDVIIDYPCNKHEGAPMTFILNLHGTTPLEQHFYQWSYFSAYKHVADHNLIIATPSSVVEQWGNGDNGADLPYLMHTIEWVYQTFGSKFDIRQMWVGGHSWGSSYTATFGCREELKDRVKGVILMSGARRPTCQANISILNTAAGMPQPEGLLDQMANATAHGCMPAMMSAIDANNDMTAWPGCSKGFVHANYMMKTKMHATSMDAPVVKSLVDWIVMARP